MIGLANFKMYKFPLKLTIDINTFQMFIVKVEIDPNKI